VDGVTPYAAGQAITYFQPGYADQVALGLNTFALNYASRDITSARTELGLRADKSFVLQSALVSASADVKWTNGFSLAGVFEGEFSGQTRGYAGKGIVRYSW
jgi:uncharacterized protein with beta-barrel porin domain